MMILNDSKVFGVIVAMAVLYSLSLPGLAQAQSRPAYPVEDKGTIGIVGMVCFDSMGVQHLWNEGAVFESCLDGVVRSWRDQQPRYATPSVGESSSSGSSMDADELAGELIQGYGKYRGIANGVAAESAACKN
jgi:hypothetical protein